MEKSSPQLQPRHRHSMAVMPPHLLHMQFLSAVTQHEPEIKSATRAKDKNEVKARIILLNRERSDADAIFLAEFFKSVIFFDKFRQENVQDRENDALMYLFKNIQYERFDAGTVIFTEGEQSNGKMYVILSGDVLVISSKYGTFITRENEHEKDKPVSSLAKVVAKVAPKTSEQTIKNKAQQLVKKMTVKKKKGNQEETEQKDVEGDVIDGADEARAYIEQRAKKKKEEGILVPIYASLFTSKLKSNLLDKKKLIESWDFDNPTPLEKGKLSALIDQYGMQKDVIRKGGYFGEKAMESHQKRNATILAKTTVELLEFNKELFWYVKKRFDQHMTKQLHFLKVAFPTIQNFYSSSVIDSFLYVMEEVNYSRNNTVTLEGTTGDKFYLLFEGVCEVTKKAIYENSEKFEDDFKPFKSLYKFTKSVGEFHITNLLPGSFFGEEIVESNSMKYDYTVRVSSHAAKLFGFKKTRFLTNFPKDACQHLLEMYLFKKKNYLAKISKELERSQPKEDEPSPLLPDKMIITKNTGGQKSQTRVSTSQPMIMNRGKDVSYGAHLHLKTQSPTKVSPWDTETDREPSTPFPFPKPKPRLDLKSSNGPSPVNSPTNTKSPTSPNFRSSSQPHSLVSIPSFNNIDKEPVRIGSPGSKIKSPQNFWASEPSTPTHLASAFTKLAQYHIEHEITPINSSGRNEAQEFVEGPDFPLEIGRSSDLQVKKKRGVEAVSSKQIRAPKVYDPRETKSMKIHNERKVPKVSQEEITREAFETYAKLLSEEDQKALMFRKIMHGVKNFLTIGPEIDSDGSPKVIPKLQSKLERKRAIITRLQANGLNQNSTSNNWTSSKESSQINLRFPPDVILQPEKEVIILPKKLVEMSTEGSSYKKRFANKILKIVGSIGTPTVKSSTAFGNRRLTSVSMDMNFRLGVDKQTRIKSPVQPKVGLDLFS